MSENLTRATEPMCPKCGGPCTFHHRGASQGRYDCADCGYAHLPDAVDWGYYPADVSAVATKLRRFAGDTDWEFGNGERADLRGWCDELEGKS